MTAGGVPGVEISVGEEAVVVSAAARMLVVSTAVVNGGLVRARSLLNLVVGHDHPHDDPVALIEGYARRHGIPGPCVGMLTGARTADAEVRTVGASELLVVAVVTAGLSNPCSAGISAAWTPQSSRRGEPLRARGIPLGTINMILIVDGAATPGALLNALTTATEAKALALFEAGLRTTDGSPATGTSTDAIAVAVTERGTPHEFGGPISELGYCVARATRAALAPAVARWMEEHR